MAKNISITSHKLSANERLKSKKLIEELFRKGSSISFHPLLLLYTNSPDSAASTKVLFSVPKKNFKNAVIRNKIKRRMRESYRLQKSILSNVATPYLIGYVYISKEELSFDVIHRKLKISLERLRDLQ